MKRPWECRNEEEIGCEGMHFRAYAWKGSASLRYQIALLVVLLIGMVAFASVCTGSKQGLDDNISSCPIAWTMRSLSRA